MDDEVFRALADPTRRDLLDALFAENGQTLGALEQRFSISRFGVMKHLRVLEDAGLVVTRKAGRSKLHYLNPVPIRELHDRWTSKYAARASAALLDLKTALERGDAVPTETETRLSHVFATFIRTTPERLWEAITTPELTSKYYFASSVESDWQPGSPLAYRIDGQPAVVGEVVESVPPERLVTTFDARWDGDVAADDPSRITWLIEEAGPGVCKLTVLHDGFAGETATYGQVGGGMPLILSGLKTLLETGRPLMAG